MLGTLLSLWFSKHVNKGAVEQTSFGGPAGCCRDPSPVDDCCIFWRRLLFLGTFLGPWLSVAVLQTFFPVFFASITFSDSLCSLCWKLFSPTITGPPRPPDCAGELALVPARVNPLGFFSFAHLVSKSS